MSTLEACLLMCEEKVGGAREGEQVCQYAGAFRRRALREQLALSRGPTEGAGEKLSPLYLFYSVYLTPLLGSGGRQGEPWQHKKSGDRDESKDTIWQRFRWQQTLRSLERGWATERLANNDVTLSNAQGSLSKEAKEKIQCISGAATSKLSQKSLFPQPQKKLHSKKQFIYLLIMIIAIIFIHEPERQPSI